MLQKNIIARILHLYIPTIEFDKVSIEFNMGKKSTQARLALLLQVGLLLLMFH